MLSADLCDRYRVLLVNDRGAFQSASLTKYITVYRLRPHSEAFEDCAFYINDKPGYGNTETFKKSRNRDQFITASMQKMFTMIPKMNTIFSAAKLPDKSNGWNNSCCD